jgi:phage/plasmid-like protein (TIGR03299 family)
MSHGITKIDKGFASGVKSTWHKLEQIKCIPERPVTVMEALSIANYGIEKQQLSRPDGTLVNAWALVRPDHNYTLVDAVGDRFEIVDNKRMVNVINENLLALYPDLKIQSVLTLWGGATFILNLSIDEFQIKGDKSPTITNLMYCNPLGKGSITCAAHSTRIVCANTAKIAETQGIANQSLKKFRHTASAHAKIDGHLIDMAELKLGLKRHELCLTSLAEKDVSTAQVDAFLSSIFPSPEKDGRGKTMALNAKAAVLNIFEGVQTQTLSKPFTRYGIYQAAIDYIDHDATSRNADIASVMYDGVMGIRADKKQKVLELLMA